VSYYSPIPTGGKRSEEGMFRSVVRAEIRPHTAQGNKDTLSAVSDVIKMNPEEVKEAEVVENEGVVDEAVAVVDVVAVDVERMVKRIGHRLLSLVAWSKNARLIRSKKSIFTLFQLRSMKLSTFFSPDSRTKFSKLCLYRSKPALVNEHVSRLSLRLVITTVMLAWV